MLNKRIIPCLLLSGGMIVKTIQFGNPRHIGEPIYAIKIFNDYEVDELLIVNIDSSRRLLDNPDHALDTPYDLISMISDESCMPVCYGGGIRTIDQIRQLFRAGIEKVCICTEAVRRPEFIRDASSTFGSQSIVVAIDVKKNNAGEYEVWSHGGGLRSDYDPVSFAQLMVEMGVGEILVNSIDRDGLMGGYDINLISEISKCVNVPVIALGGAGSNTDFVSVLKDGSAQAAAAGSIFVYFGKKKAVLINYPD
ncbi:MAG: imidazole glycerol phosphate synthase subunit HisF, partial [Methanomicrobiales archaeon]|nr:imidazole glycerol phosphate synthase subunit HisF [Methanomicrobiales archaeon]